RSTHPGVCHRGTRDTGITQVLGWGASTKPSGNPKETSQGIQRDLQQNPVGTQKELQHNPVGIQRTCQRNPMTLQQNPDQYLSRKGQTQLLEIPQHFPRSTRRLRSQRETRNGEGTPRLLACH
uniref:Uncharacterized protein n=1 Tax=Pavo cristatus TaxID=9049 RepID=A0A8C9F6S2_PAVCR